MIEWILVGIIVLLLIAYSVGEVFAGKEIGRHLSKYTYSLETLCNKIDVLTKETQEFKNSTDLNTQAINNASHRVEVFGNQLDKAFLHHKEEVQDLLDRLQAKSTADYIALERARMSPEEFMKFKLNQEEARKKQENPKYKEQQAALRKQESEVIA